jgi:predicted RNA polymerase sigma factor
MSSLQWPDLLRFCTRADYQRDFSVSYNKLGDLSVALGQCEQAREAYARSVAMAKRLAMAEPDRADYQV